MDINSCYFNLRAKVGSNRTLEEQSYSMTTSLEGFYINAKEIRNLGGCVNHSKSPNAQAECVFFEGFEQCVIVALKEIKRGEQILIDYTDSFWKAKESNKGEEMGEQDVGEEMGEQDVGEEMGEQDVFEGEEEEVDQEMESYLQRVESNNEEVTGREFEGEADFGEIESNFSNLFTNDAKSKRRTSEQSIEEMSGHKGFPTRLEFDF